MYFDVAYAWIDQQNVSQYNCNDSYRPILTYFDNFNKYSSIQCS